MTDVSDLLRDDPADRPGAGAVTPGAAALEPVAAPRERTPSGHGGDGQPPTTILPDAAAPARQGFAAGQVLVVMLIAFVLAALFNSARFVHAAEGMPFGWQRTALLAVAHPVDDVARALRLDKPRAAIDRALGRDTGAAKPPAFGGPLPSPITTPGASVSPSPGVSASPPAPAFRDATRAAPLDLFVTGDSMIEFMAPKLFSLADGAGTVAGKSDVKYGTGLVRDDFFDWPAHARAQMAQRDPEAVVMMMGGNDGQNIALAGGRILQAGSAEWTAEYQRRATYMMQLVTDGGQRRVYWVGMPPPKSARLFAIYQQINRALSASAAAVPGATFVDVWADFAPDGRYTDFLDVGGRKTLVRARDGIHLNREGAQLLARKLYSLLDRDWKVAS